MLAQLRGAKFKKGIKDIKNGQISAEPEGLDSIELCNEALGDIAEHMGFKDTAHYLQNIDKAEGTILKERNKE